VAFIDELASAFPDSTQFACDIDCLIAISAVRAFSILTVGLLRPCSFVRADVHFRLLGMVLGNPSLSVLVVVAYRASLLVLANGRATKIAT
jgi:hypothetical protein